MSRLGVLRKIEYRWLPPPGDDDPSEWLEIVAIVSGSLSGLMVGALLAWTSPSIPILISEEHDYHFTMDQCSYLTVIPPLSSIISGFMYGFLIDRIGRKTTLQTIILPVSISFLIIAFSKNIYLFYMATAIAGFANACLVSAFICYFGEISTPRVRGTWGNSMVFMVFVGQLLMNIGGGYLDIRTNALLFLISPVVFICTFSLMPESPFYLIMKGELEEARQSLMQLRRTTDIDDEFEELKAAVNRQMAERGRWRDLVITRSNRNALWVGIFVRIVQQLSGFFSFVVYNKFIFQQAAGDIISPTQCTIIFTAVCAAMNFIGAVILEKLGRRIAMLSSLSGCALFLFMEATYFYYAQKYSAEAIANYQMVPLVVMLMYVTFFLIGAGLIPGLIIGELYSAKIKGKALIIVNVAFSLLISSTTKIFQVLQKTLGMHSGFAFFGVCCVINIIGAYYFIPETGGKTLEEIQQEFKKDIPIRRQSTVTGLYDWSEMHRRRPRRHTVAYDRERRFTRFNVDRAGTAAALRSVSL